MIKAYFFDWMGTVADATDRMIVRDLNGQECHESLLVNRFHEADIPRCGDLIRSKLTNADHWLYEDSMEVISSLKPDYKLAIVSNMYDITARRVRQLFPQFLSKFDMLAFSAEVGLRKPDPQIFLYALRRLNKIHGTDILPNEVVMVGDNMDKDVGPANEAGMYADLIDRDSQGLLEVVGKV
jgi:HAD superfamily hydrolase (TIGR01549 family)